MALLDEGEHMRTIADSFRHNPSKAVRLPPASVPRIHSRSANRLLVEQTKDSSPGLSWEPSGCTVQLLLDTDLNPSRWWLVVWAGEGRSDRTWHD